MYYWSLWSSNSAKNDRVDSNGKCPNNKSYNDHCDNGNIPIHLTAEEYYTKESDKYDKVELTGKVPK